MNLPKTFGQLQSAIREQSLEGMSAGYYFLEEVIEYYLEGDLYRELPQLPCHQQGVQSEEAYQEALNNMPLTDDFWEYVKRWAEGLLDPVDRSIVTPGADEKYWDAVENHNQEGGSDILQFIDRYRETSKA